LVNKLIESVLPKVSKKETIIWVKKKLDKKKRLHAKKHGRKRPKKAVPIKYVFKKLETKKKTKNKKVGMPI